MMGTQLRLPRAKGRGDWLTPLVPQVIEVANGKPEGLATAARQVLRECGKPIGDYGFAKRTLVDRAGAKIKRDQKKSR